MPTLPKVDRSLAAMTLLVREYDEAIEFFTSTLGFALLEDTPLGDGKRWVRVAPQARGTALLLARAATDEQRESLGRQGGGRVFLFLETSDFHADYERYRLAGVQFTEAPREEPYGTVAVFLDLYGNRWDLIERREKVLPAFPPLEIVDLAAEARSSDAPYRNIVVNRVNDHGLRLSTFEGIYPWHVHPDSDELFIVVSGELAIDLADGRTLTLTPWQMATLPAGVVHRTRAIGRVANLTFEDLSAKTVFLETSDFHADYERYRLAGVQFTEAPREEPYGTVAVFLDLYGNRWDLIERREKVLPAFPSLEIVDLAAEARTSDAPYRNIVVNRVNDHGLRLSTFEGIYPWHVHPDSDELFIVVSGELAIDLADGRTLTLTPWQMATLPAGVVHRTRAIGRVANLTFEDLSAKTVFLAPDEVPQ